MTPPTLQGILSRLLHDPIAGVRGEAVKALALVATVADASAGRWLLLLGEVHIHPFFFFPIRDIFFVR